MANGDLPACGCPGAAPMHGVAAYAVHPHGMTCAACGHTYRVLWWIDPRHLCAPCFRKREDGE